MVGRGSNLPHLCILIGLQFLAANIIYNRSVAVNNHTAEVNVFLWR